MDVQLVEKIVQEVKSQGVFDEFRKDSMADVDTKPAYQNLRQRVENTVKKFLAEQKWTVETNKNQLREKLRKHITESGFLDVGVERIVDQVVNPKIGSVFQPRIEEIAYKYLGLPIPQKRFEPPPPPLMHPLPPLPLNAPPPLKVDTNSLLPTDLEQVSPDSDTTVRSGEKDDRTTVDMDTEDKILEDEDESPPFEPLIKQEIEETNDVNIEMKKESKIEQECAKFEEISRAAIKTEMLAADIDSLETSEFAIESADGDKDACQLRDAKISQDSQLSSISSDSRLYPNVKEDTLQSSSQEAVAANISEEAQMPKFNDNSCEQFTTNGGPHKICSPKLELHFDIKKDEIKFEGTERKIGLEILESQSSKLEENHYIPVEEVNVFEGKTDSFKFSTDKSGTEVKEEEDSERTSNAQELSFGSSIEDSSSAPLSRTSKNNINKEKDNSPQNQNTKLIARSSTPTISEIPTLPLPTPTPSPLASQKSDRYSSSSSKHKKHSKERRSYEREKDGDSRERHRYSKDSSKRHSSSNKRSSSSSSSKYSSPQNKNTDKDTEKSSSSSAHYSSKNPKHSQSHSSSSSNENQDSKKSKRDSERRHHSSISSSSKRVEKKDDHAEAKHKAQRRKSTDSNDEDGDKSVGSSKYSSQNKSSSSFCASQLPKSSGSEYYKSSTSRANGGEKDEIEIGIKQLDQDSTTKVQCAKNVVILNDILENPQTQFVQLNNKGHLVEMPAQLQPPLVKPEKNKMASESIKSDLLYFDEIQVNIAERLKLLNDTMDLCRCAVNSLRFDWLSDEGIDLSNEEDASSDNNKINLLTETLKRKSDYNCEELNTTPRKRVLSNESEGRQSKTSPTPSDSSSVNSKENEEFHKNTDRAKKSLQLRSNAVQKLSQQQRYSSEDLYKPRPILGQRSRRRGFDSLV